MTPKDPRLSQFPQVCVVQSSAGSGKTFELSRRYLELLINPTLKMHEIPLRNILAITFTNKAMIEMKERILESLKRIALDRFSDPVRKEELLASLGVEQEAAREKAFLILEEILRNYNFFQVQTIDSFINTILSACAFRLDLSAHFKTRTNSGDYLAYGLDMLIDRAATQKKIEELFRDFLRQYLYLENKTGWFPKKDILKMVIVLFSRANYLGGEFLLSPVALSDVIAQKRQILSQMRRLAEMQPQGTHKGFEKILKGFLVDHEDLFSINDVSGYFAWEIFPANKGIQVPSAVASLWQKIREGLRVVCEAESSVAFNTTIGIYEEVIRDFRALAHKEDILFLEELNSRARLLFDERAVTVPELYYRLSLRLKHFLFDEFQDTSRLQWKNLEAMMQEALSVGGSLFCVGDKKQAIYRFRGGDVGLFDTVSERFGDFNFIPQFLNHNYRSQKEIVEFCNTVFSPENLNSFLADKDVDKELVVKVFEGARQIPTPGKDAGFLRLEIVEAKNREEQQEIIKDKLFNLVEELLGRFDAHDIALLVRTNDEIELLTEWFVEKGIALESEKTLDIRNNSVIKEFLSLLKFLNTPIDELSFVSFILGDVFLKASGLNKEELHDFVFRLRAKNKQEKGFTLYREFRRHYPSAWETFLEEFFKNVGFLPLYELVISIFNKFASLKNFPDDQAFLMRFLEFIKEQEQEKNDLTSFLEFFDNAEGEEFYVKGQKSRAVKVLTIHKSKGLEFSVVVLPFLEMGVSVDPVLTLEAGGDLSLRRINEKYRIFSKTLDEIFRREYVRVFIDELDNIYVALTRAKEELYAFLPKAAKHRPLAAQLLFSDEVYERGKKGPARKDQRELLSQETDLGFYSCEDWIRFLKDEFADTGTILRRKQILRGEVLHDILSRIGDLSLSDKAAVFKESLQKSRLKFSFLGDLKDEEASVRMLLEEKRFHPFFYCKPALVFCEKEVVTVEGRSKRIDRLIVAKDEAWVIDYKSSSEADLEHKIQVREYLAALSGIYPQKKIKGFLIYLDSLTVEEVI